ncbi:TIGR04282 family arsenosugar biosynthesis glycosyltransferase [Tropicimonas sp.]|uniref:TIGR04282 family arsenosugar biosynthesis glycosyltransferase n=1 Tax=Tropicimonas sp. TaxID=2067044 RepID=UPI003A843197
MLKEPRPGRVKTRLGRDIGMTDAAWWFRHQALGLIRHLRDPRWDIVLAVSPDHAGMASRVWPGHLPRVAQGPGDLGDRFGRLFRGGQKGPRLIVGADVPAMRRRHIARAFDALGNHQAVLGPAPDGGYWLIGLKRATPLPLRVFAGVRWSTGQAMADTIAGLAPLRIALVDRLADVDTAGDLANAWGPPIPRRARCGG